MRHDGQNVITIIAQGTKTHTPKQLAIAEKSKKLYWCDREGMRVMRSDLGGNNVETLVRMDMWTIRNIGRTN